MLQRGAPAAVYAHSSPRCLPPAGSPVLLPGAGGDAAIGAIRSLRRAGYRGRIVTCDPDPLAAGLYLADAFECVPPIDDPGFFDRAWRLIERERVEVVLPTSGFDTIVYAERRHELEERGVVVAASPYETVLTCVDKWRFLDAVAGRFPVPASVREPDAVSTFPCFFKPARGKGSRGAVLCATRAELEARHAAEPDGIIQEYLPGEELSVDTLSDLSGEPLVAIPRIRLRIRAGVSLRGRVVHDPEIERLSLELAGFLGLRGPACVQWRRDAEGRPKLLEVNPRLGGAAIMSTLAGVNLPLLTIALAKGEHPVIPRPREITVVRYYEEVVIEGHGA